MPAHGSSQHGWRIITDNAGTRQFTPQVEYNSQTMPAHGSSHHGWRIITDNAGSQQLTPRVVNNTHTMPAHGSSHHRWKIIHTYSAGSRQLTPRVEKNTHNAGSWPRVENNTHTRPAHGSSHHGCACLGYVYASYTGLTYPWNLYITKHFTGNAFPLLPLSQASNMDTAGHTVKCCLLPILTAYGLKPLQISNTCMYKHYR